MNDHPGRYAELLHEPPVAPGPAPACDEQAEIAVGKLCGEQGQRANERLNAFQAEIVSREEEEYRLRPDAKLRPLRCPVDIAHPRMEAVEVDGVEDHADAVRRVCVVVDDIGLDHVRDRDDVTHAAAGGIEAVLRAISR